MDPELYRALKKGESEYLEEPSEDPVLTAGKNTVLHIAASHGSDPSAFQPYGSSGSYMVYEFARNSRGDTPLHCAAQAGEKNHFKSLDQKCRKIIHSVGNTPLHDVARNCHPEIVFELVQADLQLGGAINNHGESVLYIAAERGAVAIVRMLLKFPTYAVGGPNRQTARHAAVCRNYGK